MPVLFFASAQCKRPPRLLFGRWVLALLLTVSTAACTGPTAKPEPAGSPRNISANATTQNYSIANLDALLHEYVDGEGRVDYRRLKDHRAPLDRFVNSLAGLEVSAITAWPEAARIAFWINAYNAIALQRILDHYPIKRGGIVSGLRFPENSIRQIDGVWDKITTHVAGRDMTLDHIEHEILRKEFREPRVHAALVCAAKGCPPLRAEVFTEEKLSAQLDDQSRRFLGAPHRFQIDREKKIVRLSPILKWYGGDFTSVYNAAGAIQGHSADENAVLEFARRYVGPEDAKFLFENTYRVEFLDYNWSLNEQD